MKINDMRASGMKIPTLCSFAGALCAGAMLLSAAHASAQNIYVANGGNSTVGEYGLDGSLISGNDQFAANGEPGPVNSGYIGEYTTSGATVDASLISGVEYPAGIATSPVPEPSGCELPGLGAASLWFWMWRRRR